MASAIVLLLPLLLTLTAGCQKKEAPKVATAQVALPPAVVKQPHLDANWYSKDPADLNQELEEYLELAIKKCYVEADPETVRALIVPHAGLYYSGFCAATAYQTLLSNKNLFAPNIKNNKINHVIILSPDHSNLSFGITLPEYTQYHTPLGTVPVNTAAIEALKKMKLVKVSAQEHAAEHSIEMQLPWLQKTIDNFTITPLIIGNLDQYDTTQLIQELRSLITDTTLVIATSDFTHHGPSYKYQVFPDHIINYLRALDSAVIETLLKKDAKAFGDIIERTQATVCGYNPLMVLLRLLEDQKLATSQGRLCSYYTSAHLKQARTAGSSVNIPDLIGDLSDEHARETVSYAALVYSAQRISDLSKENQLTGFEKRSLTTMARESIENELAQTDRQPQQLLWPIVTPGLAGAQGAFVTLHDKNSQLRGCIGRITSLKPLYQTAQEMAISAAFKDERFAPLSRAELDDDTKISVTILSQPEKAFALSNIVVGKHGIILNKYKEDGTLQTTAVFLPEVPLSMKWDLPTTLTELSKKAGLGVDGWQTDCELQIFEGYEIKEDA
jgi:MEMO1 family protein